MTPSVSINPSGLISTSASTAILEDRSVPVHALLIRPSTVTIGKKHVHPEIMAIGEGSK